MSTTAHRYEWIDWMKAIGMYFIVLGHFFAFCNKYVYVFNVPLFFLVSGILCKKESDLKTFWRKLWYNLLLPMLLISVINFLYYSVQSLKNGSLEIEHVLWFMVNVLLGFHEGVGECWFVYTLILLKILYQYSPWKNLLCALVVVCLGLAYIYNHLDFSVLPSFCSTSNSIVNICTAYPFFALGIYIQNFVPLLNTYDNKVMLSIIFVINLFVVYVCGRFNDYVWMWQCGYGGNIVMFLLGGVSGSCCIFALSKILGHSPGFVTTLSRGTILILGFHIHIIKLLRNFFVKSFVDFGFAVILIFCFIPLIIFAEKYFPLILGKYRMKSVRRMDVK